MFIELTTAAGEKFLLNPAYILRVRATNNPDDKRDGINVFIDLPDTNWPCEVAETYEQVRTMLLQPQQGENLNA